MEPATAQWSSSVERDPFEVPLSEKVELLMDASGKMQAVKGVDFAEASIDLYRRKTAFASSEGAAIEQTITNSGGGIEATAIYDGEMQRRSFPNVNFQNYYPRNQMGAANNNPTTQCVPYSWHFVTSVAK